jgi:hypothetical protein
MRVSRRRRKQSELKRTTELVAALESNCKGAEVSWALAREGEKANILGLKATSPQMAHS